MKVNTTECLVLTTSNNAYNTIWTHAQEYKIEKRNSYKYLIYAVMLIL